MQNKNNFLDILTQFLKSNNINYQKYFYQLFNIKNNLSKNKEEVFKDEDKELIKEQFRESINDLKNENENENENENDYEYELILNKLNEIQYNIKKLSLEILKNN